MQRLPVVVAMGRSIRIMGQLFVQGGVRFRGRLINAVVSGLTLGPTFFDETSIHMPEDSFIMPKDSCLRA